ncbi:MAG: HipA domain-containing protein [Lachnospiraceae bacterium]|nr:HipA domain-containing protein [Lachnospiraceae bacterium]
MADMDRVYVYENWKTDEPSLIGTLYVDSSRSGQVVSFEYDEAWYSDVNNNIMLDPDIMFYKGRQYLPYNKLLFGMFEDSCPDRWGRVLMNRHEAIIAKEENRRKRTLSEIDYLVGVYDKLRMGGLRFSAEKGGTFLTDDKEYAVPPWVMLRELEAASIAFENKEEVKKEIKQLMRPGSSLGGARPKASIEDVDGSLWIAKFPSTKDDINVGAWEMVVHDLALMCELNVPEAKLQRFSDLGSTFIVKRFDRINNRRVHFASAMTLLGKIDGKDDLDGTSYFDIASIIKSYSSSPKEDLRELWKRIVFFMAVSNTDDHLRNHGFVLSGNSWRLSPLYDVNPTINSDELKLIVDQDTKFIDFNLALSAAKYYEVTDDEAVDLIESVIETVADKWESLAKKYGISHNEIEYVRPAFDMSLKPMLIGYDYVKRY